MQKTSSIAIIAALALVSGQAAFAQAQNSTTTGQQIIPLEGEASTSGAAGTNPDNAMGAGAGGGAIATDTDVEATDNVTGTDTVQTTPPAGAPLGTGDTSETVQSEPLTQPDMNMVDTEMARPDGMSEPFLTLQAGDMYLGSNLMGANVLSAANEDIGDVNDVVFDSQGRGLAVVIGVGGFLGIGEKNVAVPFERLTLTREEGSDDDIVISLETTRDELNNAPEFRDLDDAETATSSTEGVTPIPNSTGATDVEEPQSDIDMSDDLELRENGATGNGTLGTNPPAAQ